MFQICMEPKICFRSILKLPGLQELRRTSVEAASLMAFYSEEITHALANTKGLIQPLVQYLGTEMNSVCTKLLT